MNNKLLYWIELNRVKLFYKMLLTSKVGKNFINLVTSIGTFMKAESKSLIRLVCYFLRMSALEEKIHL